MIILPIFLERNTETLNCLVPSTPPYRLETFYWEQNIISKKKKILQGMKNNPVRPPECVCCCVADRNEWMGMNYMLYFEKIFSFPD